PTPVSSSLSLHDALPISRAGRSDARPTAERAGRGRPVSVRGASRRGTRAFATGADGAIRTGSEGPFKNPRPRPGSPVHDLSGQKDRKSTRLNSSHVKISY